jgi:hypothetical protein
MPFQDYSATPSENVSIAGINIAEGCPAGNANNALRQLAADGKALATTVSAIPAGIPIAGGVFTGDITRQSRGAFLHHADASLSDGRTYFSAEGAALPSTPIAGMVVWFYTP